MVSFSNGIDEWSKTIRSSCRLSLLLRQRDTFRRWTSREESEWYQIPRSSQRSILIEVEDLGIGQILRLGGIDDGVVEFLSSLDEIGLAHGREIVRLRK